MTFGLDGNKLILILVIGVIIVGPERLPALAEGFARMIKAARSYLQGARDRVQDEMGEDFNDVDWKKLDPRQYDPRRIIRDALLDDEPVAAAAAPRQVPQARAQQVPLEPGAVPPFDSEAT